MTAAHQQLPFGTLLRVENRDNGRSTELTVTDRGPFAKDRILDVSRAGARALDMIGPGTARVRITILKAGGDIVSARGGCVDVQVGSYRDRESAETERDRARRSGFPARVERNGRVYRVLVGPFTEEREAESAIEAFEGFPRRCSM
ncbi:MAG: SPOR domain-containing protein [Gemmatimonadetes bacterium]|nr:SPOR domain-containing protein [Gemmatimonadota bacterium]